MTSAGEADPGFSVTSMFGYHSQQPLVSMKLLHVEVQVSPAKAREMAVMLVEAAEAAEEDAYFMDWPERGLGLKDL